MKGGLAEAAIDVVKDKKIMIRPEKSEREYSRWTENINDWCLSRQLWWGYQPLTYFVKIEAPRYGAVQKQVHIMQILCARFRILMSCSVFRFKTRLLLFFLFDEISKATPD